MLFTNGLAICGFPLPPVNVERAQLLATRLHHGQVQRSGEPLIDHVGRVAASSPPSARAVAWLHEVLEWTAVSEQELLAEGVSDDELRALRLLTRTVGRGTEAGYLAHINMIARADGPAGELARTVKASDLNDRLGHGGPAPHPPYDRALRLILAAEAPAA